MVRNGRKTLWLMVVPAVISVLSVSYGVYASHNFNDVPPGAFSHNAVEWVFNRGVSLGCGAGLYCPDEPVSRAEMAIFMRRLGIALTPGYVEARDDAPDVDLTSEVVRCQTAPITPRFPQRAFILAHLAIRAPTAGALTTGLRTVFSTDGGATYGDTPDALSLGATSPAGQTTATSTSGSVDLDPGTPYRFGVRVSHVSGPTTAEDFICAVRVHIFNRNPGSSPLSPEFEPEQIVGPMNVR